jgi:hypothetical protein
LVIGPLLEILVPIGIDKVAKTFASPTMKMQSKIDDILLDVNKGNITETE